MPLGLVACTPGLAGNGHNVTIVDMATGEALHAT
jgi:hypothetical protein